MKAADESGQGRKSLILYDELARDKSEKFAVQSWVQWRRVPALHEEAQEALPVEPEFKCARVTDEQATVMLSAWGTGAGDRAHWGEDLTYATSASRKGLARMLQIASKQKSEKSAKACHT